MVELRWIRVGVWDGRPHVALKDGEPHVLQYREWPSGMHPLAEQGNPRTEPMWQDVPVVAREDVSVRPQENAEAK